MVPGYPAVLTVLRNIPCNIGFVQNTTLSDGIVHLNRPVAFAAILCYRYFTNGSFNGLFTQARKATNWLGVLFKVQYVV